MTYLHATNFAGRMIHLDTSGSTSDVMLRDIARECDRVMSNFDHLKRLERDKANQLNRRKYDEANRLVRRRRGRAQRRARRQTRVA